MTGNDAVIETTGCSVLMSLSYIRRSFLNATTITMPLIILWLLSSPCRSSRHRWDNTFTSLSLWCPAIMFSESSGECSGRSLRFIGVCVAGNEGCYSVCRVWKKHVPLKITLSIDHLHHICCSLSPGCITGCWWDVWVGGPLISLHMSKMLNSNMVHRCHITLLCAFINSTNIIF